VNFQNYRKPGGSANLLWKICLEAFSEGTYILLRHACNTYVEDIHLAMRVGLFGPVLEQKFKYLKRDDTKAGN